jgi:hypothetical protein
MTRVAYRLYRIGSAFRYRTRRHVMAGGWLVAIGLFLTAGMSTDVEQSMGYQAFSLLAALGLVGLLFTPFFRIKYTAERTLPRFGTVGQALHYNITIQHSSGAAQHGLTVFEELADPRPTYDDFLRATKPTRRRQSFRISTSAPVRRIALPRPRPLPVLRPGAEESVEMKLLPTQRGVLHFRGVSLARPDPFQLFRSFASVLAPAALTILPKRYSLPNISLPGSARHQQGGTANASSIGESEEFVALRDYRYGDSMRRIHWRSWAKAGRPVTKEYQDEFFVRHALILDTFTDPDNVELFEEAVSVAASFACTIDTQESLLDLLFVGPEAYSFTIGRGIAHADQMLEILASVETCLSKPFEALEQVVIEHSAVVSGCICIFVEWDERRERLVRKLEALGVPVLLLLLRQEDGSAAARSDSGRFKWRSQRGSPSQERDEGKFAVNSPVHELHVGRIAEDLARL